MNRIPAKNPRLRLVPDLYEHLRQQVLRQEWSNTLRRVHKTSRQAGLRCGLLLVTAIDDEDRNLDVGHEVHRILFRQCKATRR